MIYLTYNDQPSGVYSSQVIDTVNFMGESHFCRIRLVAFISMRGFKTNRSKIKAENPGALVLPIIPRAMQSFFSKILFWMICLSRGERSVICRNVLACQLAFFARRAGLAMRICYDGRGAIAAEWNEYEVVPSQKMKKAIYGLEREAVLNSDFRIAVSQQLINHWQTAFEYHGSEHVVIPCTVNSGFRQGLPSENKITAIRQALDYSPDDFVLVYSGSTAGWQSFSTLGLMLKTALSSSPKVKLLFLSGPDPAIAEIKTAFLGQVERKWLKHTEVTDTLLACDAGILFREQSVTNKVAAPTKFAEYLSAGLPVIISEHLGDYSDFVREQKCGQVLDGTDEIKINPVSYAEKERLNKLVFTFFTKQSQKENYLRVVSAINSN
ncbi:MAG TPA: hypothetical protein VFW78_04835 [Bacteroidia bacterium]|nr:hypothetical protein [Bacteroidia bacterium]